MKYECISKAEVLSEHGTYREAVDHAKEVLLPKHKEIWIRRTDVVIVSMYSMVDGEVIHVA